MFTRETVAVVVSYNPDPEVLRRVLDSLDRQCPAIVIDNGSSDNLINGVKNLVSSHTNTDLLCLAENLGIAHAQNTAVQHILSSRNNARFVLMLDHDSIPSSDMVTVLMKTFDSLAREDMKVGAVGPVLHDPRNNTSLKFHKLRPFHLGKISPDTVGYGNPVVKVDGLNSSGTLISLAAYRDTGGFDDLLFIDHVETDWCFMASAKGYGLYATVATHLTHIMGDDLCHYWLFGKRTMPYRSPQRHYYIVRNSLLLQKREYVPLAWKLSNLLKLVLTYLYFGLYHSDRQRQRKQINRGLRDGMRGITGKSRPQLREQIH